MPIDKFKDIKQEDELLEYVITIADNFIPDVDIQDGNAVLLPSQAPFLFKRQYNAKKLNVFFEYKNYMKNDGITSIQAIIHALGIDSEKFWYLLLFISDYVNGRTLNTCKSSTTPEQDITKFIEMVKQNETGFNKATGFSHQVPMTLNLQIKGKRLIIENPNTISFIAAVCNEAMAKLPQYSLLNQTKFETDNYYTSDSARIWLFTKMLQYFFEAYPQFDNQRGTSGSTSKSKFLFISKLIYFTKLTTNKAYDEDDDNLKKIIKQYKDKEIPTSNLAYD
ncbi:hypothetical protein [Bacteroides sp.]|uniref:hypothetical protein n=1 Tax=Bacteroides sp. TaxID=29523 RepID=UPI0025BBDB43|nr:hypothetical protein [Bacteroides sp.]